MTVTLFDAPHRPDTTGICYTLWTEEHDRQTSDLTPCASKLYRWLLERAPGGVEQEVDLGHFQDFTRSARRKNGYHLNHILRAFNSLQELGFVAVTHWFGKRLKRVARLIVRHVGNVKPIELRQKKSYFLNFQGENATKKLLRDTPNSDSAVLDNREFKDYQSPTTPMQSEVVDFSEQEEEVSINLSVEDKYMDKPLHKESEDIPEGDLHAAVPRLEDEKRQLLASIRSLEIPLTPYLQQLVWRSSVAVIESAIAAFKEQQEKGNVKVPAAFMIRAIERGFQPTQEVRLHRELDEFNAWYEQNKHRILATYSHSNVTGLPEGQIGVMLRGSDRWIYWREVDEPQGGGGR